MENLDDETAIAALDKSGMRQYILDLPNQIKLAAKLAQDLSLPDDYKNVKNAIIIGMGGSAIGADLTRNLLAESCNIPLEIVRDYSIPAYVDSSTLAVVVSFSGNTEEALKSYELAKAKKAKLVAITKGGKLAEQAENDTIPLLQFSYDSQPRAALGYLFVPLVVILEKLGLAKSKFDFSAIEIKFDEELAKVYAKKIQNKIPIICASSFLTPVAKRFKNQINENSKQAAVAEEIPELFHNVVQGLDFPEKLSKFVTFIILESNFYHERNILRIKILKDILKEKNISYQNIVIDGKNKLEQMLNAIALADLTSFYLAMLNDVDPTIIPTINYLKQRLELGR